MGWAWPGRLPDHRSLGLKKEANASDLGLPTAAKEWEVRDILQNERRIFDLAIFWGDESFY